MKVKIKKTTVFILCFTVLCGCNNNINSIKLNGPVKENKNEIYKKLTNKFSDKLILKAIFCLNNQKKEKFNGKENLYIDSQLLDSILNCENLENLAIKKLNELPINKQNSIEKWCEIYVTVDYIFSNLKENYYFEDIAFQIIQFKNVFEKYLTSTQTIDSLSRNQSEMIFYDFINYLETTDIKTRNSIIENCLKYTEK